MALRCFDDLAGADACPIVASYGGNDRSLSGAPAQLEHFLTHRVESDITVYPDAGHGFLNNYAPGETPIWALVARKLVHAGSHESSAADTRQRSTPTWRSARHVVNMDQQSWSVRHASASHGRDPVFSTRRQIPMAGRS
jgi:dienelactone hydrolase